MQQIMHIMIMYLEYIETNFKNQERKRLLKEKLGKDKNRQFTEEKTQRINKHIERCSTSLVIREIQSKRKKGFYCLPIISLKYF